MVSKQLAPGMNTAFFFLNFYNESLPGEIPPAACRYHNTGY